MTRSRAQFLWCIIALVASTPSAAADLQGRGRLWVGPGFDSNAPRDFLRSNQRPYSDGFVYGLGQVEGVAAFANRLHLIGSYDVAGRKFLLLPSADTIVQAAQGEAALSLHRLFAIALVANARDRRGAERDYTDVAGGLSFDLFLHEQFDLRLQAKAHRFLFHNRFAYSYFAPEGFVSLQFRANRRHHFDVSGGASLRSYDSKIAVADGYEPPHPLPQRSDVLIFGGARYAYRGPFHFSVGYTYFNLSSNSWGESFRRHRVSIAGGVRLPWEISALGSASIFLSSYPDGVYLAPNLTVIEDDENASAVSVKLTRSLGSHFEVDARYGAYFNSFPRNEYTYLRHVVTIGCSYLF